MPHVPLLRADDPTSNVDEPLAMVDLQAAKEQMLRNQLQHRGIHDRGVLAAMAKVPRERFVAPELCNEAYADRALAIDCNQTISQPYIVGLMTQALALSGDQKVLEIGTGSGYQTAILAELAREVVSVERHAELSRQAGEVLSALGYGNVTLVTGDGTLGCPGRAPFDRIIVTAATAECPPMLFEQLEEGGILVIPLGGRDYQTLQAIHKVAGRPQAMNLSACRFVPLVGAYGWPE
jgi:protein-L-isoaspartate(D-aspartate) O-methyltransferase